MISIALEDERLLLNALRSGEIVLLLGAGASATSTLPNGEAVRQASSLAALLAEKAGLAYANETLTEVLGATLNSRISQEQLNRILRAEYTKVRPSDELKQLFDYTWRRIYTWNIDDAVENVPGGVQSRRYFNGLRDKVSGHEGLEYLPIVHLHGEALKPEHGFIFSASEYNARLNQDSHDWYREAALDYAAHVPVFIGSRLNEPILGAELDRARPAADSGLGRAFLVAPDNFSEIQVANFRSRGIVVVRATLKQFIDWIRERQTQKIVPIDVARTQSAFVRSLSNAIRVRPSDVETARSIILHTWKDAKKDADAFNEGDKKKAARQFLEGQPPTWKLVATGIPVWLSSTNLLYAAMEKSIKARDRVFLVHGQSGSGKTTALMQSVLRYLRDHPDAVCYELRGNVPSLRDALALLHRLHERQHVVVFAGDAFIYGDSLNEDVAGLPAGAMTVLLSARSGEWSHHIRRRIKDICTSFQFERFSEKDFQPLINVLLEYVPAPRFKRLSAEARVEKLRGSKNQLLIALREATESEAFNDTITGEYKRLPNDDCRLLAVLVGIPTIARTGVTPAVTREVYKRLAASISFEEASLALDGIVSLGQNGRLVARHELYVRHILENVVEFRFIVEVMIELLRTYTKFKSPIVKNVSRLDALLFKFLLNYRFASEIGTRRGELSETLRIFQEFEVEFQLDGHFWLQYGLLLVKIGDISLALKMLGRSIQAYPDNPFAVHALADTQLQAAIEREEYDAVTVKLIGDAVQTLEAMDITQGGEEDHYPIVTLALKHVGVLVRHKQSAKAKEVARKYFRRLEERARRVSDDALQSARERLAHYVTHETWPPLSASFDQPEQESSRATRKKRKEFKREN
jgi:hypothetical protein